MLKSQQALARISTSDGSLSSQGSSSSLRHRGIRLHRPSQGSEEEDTARINSSPYIEARDLLRPSLDAFARAVGAADAQGSTTGELLQLVSTILITPENRLAQTLVQAAEAYISFGNVSHPRNNETCYQRALGLLQRASRMIDHVMDPYLQE